MGDVLESVAELAYYRGSIFCPPTRSDITATGSGPEPAGEGRGDGREKDISES
jgi:hypothetical protein